MELLWPLFGQANPSYFLFVDVDAQHKAAVYFFGCRAVCKFGSYRAGHGLAQQLWPTGQTSGCACHTAIADS